MHQLILGGARSGKSRLAESSPVTAACRDLHRHQPAAGRRNERSGPSPPASPGQWGLIEEPLNWPGCCAKTPRRRCLLVDCLTLWLTNLLMLDDPTPGAERDALLECLASLPGEIIFVSNETGMGVVPLGELTRRYVDEAGWLHQALAERCQRCPDRRRPAPDFERNCVMTHTWWLNPCKAIDAHASNRRKRVSSN
jgi:adenosylcobinamide kinase/adenosylcobinamide-phosphate guanylyltransferase